MRILIDAYQMRHVITGTDRQARNILRELQKIDHDNEYIVVVNRDEPYVSEVVKAPNFHIRPSHLRKRASWIYFGLPVTLVRLNADVFYSFHNLTAPGIPVRPSVVSTLDLVPFMYQKRYYQGLGDYWIRRPLVLGYMRIAAKTGAAFWAISLHTQHQVASYFHVDERKFKHAYMQADPIFAEKPDEKKLAALKKRLGIDDGFVYAIGGAEPRKNNLLLIAAHRRLPEDLRRKYPLVIAGAAWQGEDFDRSNDPYIILAGYVTDQEHAQLYHAATAFVCASTYEGFGLPVLEAMMAGAPVLCSNTTSLPEVAGDAAIMFDPSSEDELYNALESVLASPSVRERLRKAGFERVKLFSWAQTAETIHDLIIRVGSKRH